MTIKLGGTGTDGQMERNRETCVSELDTRNANAGRHADHPVNSTGRGIKVGARLTLYLNNMEPTF